MTASGSIIWEECYALGKMLDHSGWKGLLRDGITWSDVDFPHVPMCADNKGAVILAELSSTVSNWNDVPYPDGKGQRGLYEALIRGREKPFCAVLCKHSVQPELGRKIDTLNDIEQFQIMVWDFEPVLSPIYEAQFWRDFVRFWVNKPDGPMRIRRHLLGVSIGMVKPEKGPAIE